MSFFLVSHPLLQPHQILRLLPQFFTLARTRLSAEDIEALKAMNLDLLLSEFSGMAVVCSLHFSLALHPVSWCMYIYTCVCVCVVWGGDSRISVRCLSCHHGRAQRIHGLESSLFGGPPPSLQDCMCCGWVMVVLLSLCCCLSSPSDLPEKFNSLPGLGHLSGMIDLLTAPEPDGGLDFREEMRYLSLLSKDIPQEEQPFAYLSCTWRLLRWVLLATIVWWLLRMLLFPLLW